MSFMQPETSNDDFFVYEAKHGGTECIPAYVTSKKEIAKENGIKQRDIETISGKWFARYQAPGYMDSTDWSGPYDTETEALADVKEMYGDEDENE